MPPLEDFVDELSDRTTPLGNPYKMGINGRDERLRNPVCEAHIRYLELDPATASPARLAAAASNIARECVRGYSKLQPPPIASQIPIAARMQASRALAERVAAGQSIRLLCHCPPGKRCHLQAVASRIRNLAFSLASPMPPCSSCDTDDGETCNVRKMKMLLLLLRQQKPRLACLAIGEMSRSCMSRSCHSYCGQSQRRRFRLRRHS
jgi:hypothetical protein